MRYEIHGRGARSAETLLGEYETFDAARAAFDGLPGEPWAIVPAGRADELAALGSLASIVPHYGHSRDDGGLYVLSEGEGYSCLGFDVAERKRAAVAAWLESEGKRLLIGAPVRPGTPDAFLRYRATMDAGRKFAAATGKRCPAELTPELIGLEGKRVEIVEPSGERRRFTVGKSTGWLPCHLEIEGRADGGPAVHLPEGSTVRVLERERAGR